MVFAFFSPRADGFCIYLNTYLHIEQQQLNPIPNRYPNVFGPYCYFCCAIQSCEDSSVSRTGFLKSKLDPFNKSFLRCMRHGFVGAAVGDSSTENFY